MSNFMSNDNATTILTAYANAIKENENVQSDWNESDNSKDDYIKNKPTLGTVAAKNVPASGDAASTEVVMGNDSRLTDARNAADVSAWAKASTKPSYTASEVGLGNVPNVTTDNQTPTVTEASTRANLATGDTLKTIIGKIKKYFTDLKTVAFTGSYNDLSDKPTIPAGTVTSVSTGTGLNGGTITSSGTISIGNHSANYITGGYLNIHPENSPTLIPFMNNDIAYLLKRGGSAVVKYDGVTQQSTNISNTFDASPSYWTINATGVTTITVELTLHKSFGWSNTVYCDNGSNNWRAKNVKIEVMNSNYSGDTWTQKYANTNLNVGHFSANFTHIPVGASGAGDGFNKIRFTFSEWNVADNFRIAQLGLYNYESKGLRETFLPKDGGDVYGSIYPNTNNGANLGATTNYWNNAYITNINGVAVGNSPKFTDTNNRKSFYGTCSTAADVATKVVTLTNTAGWELTAGTIVGVSFDYTNTAESVKLNINNTGAKSIWYDGDIFDGTSSYICGRSNHRTIYYMYDGTYWRWFSMGAQWPDGRVDQTATDSTNSNYEIIFSGTADNTTRTETTRKSSKLTFNPSTGNLQTTQLNGVTVGSSPKFTDTTYTAATAAPGAIASSGSAGTSTNYARQDHTHAITVATGDSNGQVKIAGQNASVKGLGTAAYTASTDYARRTTLTNQDLNDIKGPGFYNAGGGNTVANKPTNVDAFGLEVVHCAGGEYYVQLLYPSSSNIAYRRCCANNTWYAWSQDKYTDTNDSVRQWDSSSNSDYRVVFSGNANDTSEINAVRKNTNFKYNPSTQNLMVPKINGVTMTSSSSAANNVISSTVQQILVVSSLPADASSHPEILYLVGGS